MNKVILVGRLASKPYKGITASSVEYSRFTVVVTRTYSTPNSEPVADFIPCVAWRSNASFINKFLDKGSLMLVEGTFQSTRTTDQNGQLINNYVVSADKIQSLESREVTEARRKNNFKEFSISNEENNKVPTSEQPSTEHTSDVDDAIDGLSWDF
ncbi:single-stranded DNA-binding protein [Mycoplasma sp. 527]